MNKNYGNWCGEDNTCSPGQGTDDEKTLAQTQLQLRECEQRFQALIAASPDAIYRMSADWKVLYRLVGHGFVADTDSPCTDWLDKYIAPEDHDMLMDHAGKAIRNKSVFALEHRARRNDGTLGWTYSRATPILSAQGEILEWFGLAGDVTARREAQEQLRLAAEGARLGVWFWHLPDGKLEWSDLCKEYFALPEGETPSIAHFIDALHPDDRDAARRSLAEALACNDTHSAEYRIVQADGSVRWFESKGRVFRTPDGISYGMGGVVIDIHEQKIAEQELARYRARLEELVGERTAALTAANAERDALAARLQVATRAAGLGVWSWNFADDALTWNEQMHALYDLPPATTPDMAFLLARVHPDDRPIFEMAKITQQTARQTDEPLSCHFRLLLSGNQVRHVKSTSLTLFDADGTPTGAVGTSEDVSARVNAERELMQATRSAETANVAKSKFLAAASHDLRQPLAASTLYLDILQKSPLNEKQKLVTEHLKRSVDTLTVMLNTLLDIARLDAGAVTAKFSSTPALRIATWAKDEFGEQFRARNLCLRIVQTRRDLTLDTDPTLLKSALRNLLVNALKFCTTGGCLVALRQRRDRCLIQVWDTGIGIAAEHLDLVFKEYFQVGNEERDRSKGLGLGLSIAQRLTALIGGELSCRSRPGRGSLFELSLPLTSVDKATPAAGVSSVSEAELLARRFAGRHLVLIEDNPDVCRAMVLALETYGLRVSAFRDARQALAHPDIARADFYISDYRLPGPLDGWQLLKEIEQRRGTTPRALLITGETTIHELIAPDFAPWKTLIKPCDAASLLGALAS